MLHEVGCREMTGAKLNSWGQTPNLGTGVLAEGPQ